MVHSNCFSLDTGRGYIVHSVHIVSRVSIVRKVHRLLHFSSGRASVGLEGLRTLLSILQWHLPELQLFIKVNFIVPIGKLW